MYLLSSKIKSSLNNNSKIIIEKIKPFLLHGTIILTSNFSTIASLISPSPIKHCSFCLIENGIYYAVEISEKGFTKRTLEEFFINRGVIVLFHYYDLKVMNECVDVIYEYQDQSYGFLKDNQYCFKIVFTLYNRYFGYPYKKMSEFIPVFTFLGNEFVNANSFFKSKTFIPKCYISSNKYIEFEN